MGRGGAGARPHGGQADLPVDRLCRLSLVPRDGARIVRGPGHGRRAQSRFRADQGRSRGAPGPRPGVHGRGPGHDRQRRLADERLPDPGRPPFLWRDVLPGDAPPRVAVIPTGARRRRQGVPRGAPGDRAVRIGDRQGDRRFVHAQARRRIGGGRDAARSDGARRSGRRARAVVRPAPRRLGWRAEVPGADDDRVPAPASGRGRRRRPRPGDGPADARRDGRRRDPRPARRRLPPLRHGRGLARAALRADALRQRPARPGLCPRLAADRRPALWRRGARHARLPGARAADRRRWVCREPGRRHRGRGRGDVRLVARAGQGGSRARLGAVRRCLRRDRRWQLGGPFHPAPGALGRRARDDDLDDRRRGPDEAGRRQGHPPRHPRDAAPAGPRRQGPGRLEWPGARGTGRRDRRPRGDR